MSADYSGSNGSDLTAAILGATSQLGSAAILSTRSPQLATPYYQRPVTTSVLPLSNNSSMTTFVVLGGLILLGIFAVKKL